MLSSNLLYTYSIGTTKGDNPKLVGEPDKSLFNRNEKYEVIYLVNKFCVRHGLTQITDGQKVERLIHEYLPSGLHSQEHVMEWLRVNYNSLN